MSMSGKKTWSNEGMICHHCEHLNKPEEAHHYDEDVNEQWCDSCGRKFTTSCYVSHSWTSNTLNNEDK